MIRAWVWGTDLGRRLEIARLLAGVDSQTERFELQTSNSVAFVTATATPSLFGTRTVVAGPASKLSPEQIAELDQLPDVFNLVLWNERKPAAKSLAAASSFQTYIAPNPTTLDLANSLGLELSSKAVGASLERRCNWNRDQVWNVLRLAAAASTGDAMTLGDLEVFIGAASAPVPWEVTDALLSRDAHEALDLAERPGQEPIPFLAWTAKWLSLITLVTTSGLTAERLVQEAAVTPRQAKSYIKAAAKVTTPQLAHAWDAHAAAELQSRSAAAGSVIVSLTLDLLDAFSVPG